MGMLAFRVIDVYDEICEPISSQSYPSLSSRVSEIRIILGNLVGVKEMRIDNILAKLE